MKETQYPENLQEVIAKQEREVKWLLSLVTDPTGERYLIDKSPEQREEEYREQIARMGKYLDFIDNPQDKFSSAHIAGTGGKGTVTTMLGEILQESGFKTGVHTSPYLQVPNEKLLIDGKMIAPSGLTQLIQDFRSQYEAYKKKYPGEDIKYGEAWVALTYQYFAEKGIDWGVIETGMGGRYDPTNVLNSEVSIVTNVDYDHVPQLGTTLEDVALHKAGIVKTNTPVVIGERKKNISKIIQMEAEQKNAPAYVAGEDFDVKIIKADSEKLVLNLRTPFNEYDNLTVSLPGIFQAQNTALAVTAADILAERHGVKLGKNVIEMALSKVEFPGRMEVVQKDPDVILDGAHNAQKTEALTESMQKIYPETPYSLIMGMLATKDARSAVVPLLTQAKNVIATQPHVFGKPALSCQDLASIIKEIDPSLRVESIENVSEAIQKAIAEAKAEDKILITGSLYMLGEARESWFSREDILANAEYG